MSDDNDSTFEIYRIDPRHVQWYHLARFRIKERDLGRRLQEYKAHGTIRIEEDAKAWQSLNKLDRIYESLHVVIPEGGK